jgi:hypothetical protein
MVGLALRYFRLISACSSSAPPAPTPPPITPLPAQVRHQISLPAQAGWVKTAISLTAGQLVAIRAQGAVILIDGGGPIAPAGTAEGCTKARAEAQAGMRFTLDCLLDQAPYGALIGRIGDTGAPFVIGAAAQLIAPASGELELAVNDCCALDDNQSTFTVLVKVYGR